MRGCTDDRHGLYVVYAAEGFGNISFYYRGRRGWGNYFSESRSVSQHCSSAGLVEDVYRKKQKHPCKFMIEKDMDQLNMKCRFGFTFSMDFSLVYQKRIHKENFSQSTHLCTI